ncbi:alpha beta-hydrolase [Ramaria rubella]|nr:alpha beta-hydrolase [Ramaria rubella]
MAVGRPKKYEVKTPVIPVHKPVHCLPNLRYHTAETVAAQSLSAGIEDLILDPVTSKVYFAQKRPGEGGRSAIVDANDYEDLFDGSWDARTQVHEYGGAAATVFGDRRVYKTTKGGTPVPVTPRSPYQRFADFAVHPVHSHLLISLVEDHTNPHPAKVLTYLALINVNTSEVVKAVEGADYYACPRFSPDGRFLVWQQWFFPEMPFQSSEIKIASVNNEAGGQTLKIGPAMHIAGETEKIVAQDPNWTSNSCIVFFSDVSGYLNPWMFSFDPADIVSTGKASPILSEPMEEEFGRSQWFLSYHAIGALSETRVACCSFRSGVSTLHVCDLSKRTIVEIPTDFACINYVHGDGKGKAVLLGQPGNAGDVLAELSSDAAGEYQLKSLSPPQVENEKLPSSFVSAGEHRTFQLPPDNRTCHVTYYPPKNPNYSGGLPGERPPVLTFVHGGPWYMEPSNLNWSKQFYTSRGWAYIDVNYGGSTGHGRQFRESLEGKWGVLDVEDSYHSVIALDALGLVDAKRAVVHGQSAGGYTTLQIATSRPTEFAAGSPRYGISDMRKLDEILHKFEYYLCDRLMGGTWEECEDVWRARANAYSFCLRQLIDIFVQFLQGEDDTVVPAEQMIEMVKTLKDRGAKVELVLFPGEGHGWRKASTIQTVLERELKFFNEVLGLENTP